MVKIAAQEFQEFISSESQKWVYDFSLQKGKMFGVLVVQNDEDNYCYIGTVSGTLGRNTICENFIPSVFDDSVDDFFINKGMTALTELSNTINQSTSKAEVAALIEQRKQKSFALQQQLFRNYQFLNILGSEKSLLQIFEDSTHGKPPSAAGECAAPKLLQYALKHQLKPIALAEFWWGNSLKNKERRHKAFYPACKDKCRPILEYMLNDKGLFEQAEANTK